MTASPGTILKDPQGPPRGPGTALVSISKSRMVYGSKNKQIHTVCVLKVQKVTREICTYNICHLLLILTVSTC